MPVFDARWNYNTKRRIIGMAQLQDTAFCFRHNTQCHLPMSDVDVSGSPCVAWSPAGNRRGLDDPTNHCFLAWARIMDQQRVAIALHENVPQFDDIMAQGLLPNYYCYKIELDCADVGFPFISRARQFLLCVRKTRGFLQHDVYHILECVKEKLQNPSLGIQHCLVASEAEIFQEEQLACKARSITLREHAGQRDLSYCLSPSELAHMRDYDQMWQDRDGTLPHTIPWLAYNLADNPRKRLCWSASGRLPTFRRNSLRIWVPAKRRWLTERERLMSMGFCTYENLAEASGAEVVRPESREARHMLGNAMHLPSVSVALAISLACCRLR